MNPFLVETDMVAAMKADALSTAVIYTGASYQELTPESLNLVVACTQLEHVTGTNYTGNLYKAIVDIKVTSPALFGASAMSEFLSMINTLRDDVLQNFYFTSNWPSNATTFNGLWVSETKQSQHDHGWVCDISVIVGITQ
jgi:hypothetical protein